jgi:hypothetical protein
MSELPKVVLCDDEEKNSAEWKQELDELPGMESRFEVLVVEADEFNRDMKILEGRREALREKTEVASTRTIFDDAAVLIVDYDLYDYDPKHLFTGDSVAYLARSFSSCGFIVGVNQDRMPNPFDATLTANSRLPTDLSIGNRQVADPGLWCPDPDEWNAFRPWSWPCLPERVIALRTKTEELEGELDAPLQEILGIEESAIMTMPGKIVGPLDVPTEKHLPAVSVRDWVHGAQMGLRSGDVISDPSQIARVAAARLAKWLEFVLLPGQDFLVDAPHLVERRPGLLGGDSADPAAWQAAVQVGEEGEKGLDAERIREYSYGAGWLSRPVWRWRAIASDPNLDEAAEAIRPQKLLVFAEDQSRFIEAGMATRFRSDVDSPFKSRWLGVPDQDVTYLPAARLTSG